MTELREQIKELEGHLDTLVHNAGANRAWANALRGILHLIAGELEESAESEENRATMPQAILEITRRLGPLERTTLRRVMEEEYPSIKQGDNGAYVNKTVWSMVKGGRLAEDKRKRLSLPPEASE